MYTFMRAVAFFFLFFLLFQDAGSLHQLCAFVAEIVKETFKHRASKVYITQGAYVYQRFTEKSTLSK